MAAWKGEWYWQTLNGCVWLKWILIKKQLEFPKLTTGKEGDISGKLSGYFTNIPTNMNLTQIGLLPGYSNWT